MFLEADQLPDGVYLGLPESRYFAQAALGSSDLANLWLYEEGWWWTSRWNPWWTDLGTKAKAFGSAAHCFLLEGPGPFKARYAVEPDPRQFPQLLVKRDDIISALRETGAPGKPEYAKLDALIELAKVYLPDHHVWPSIMDRFERSKGTRVAISAQDHWELEVMRDAAMSDPDMAAVITADGGVPLVEVSVFWTLADGTRLRFRFDALIPAANADLKTLGNVRGRDLTDAVGRRIGDGALDVQAAISFEARRHAYDHLAAGRLYVCATTDEPPALASSRPRVLRDQVAWLKRFVLEAPLDLGDRPGWFWIWLFYQKPDGQGAAPTIFPATMAFGSLEHRDGYRKAATGLDFYRRKVAQVGLDKPWTRVAPVHRFDAAAPVRVTIPHWIKAPLAVADEEDALTWRT